MTGITRRSFGAAALPAALAPRARAADTPTLEIAGGRSERGGPPLAPADVNEGLTMINATLAALVIGIGLVALGGAAQAQQYLESRTLNEMCNQGSYQPAEPSMACFGVGYNRGLERAGVIDLAR
ncbi:MAG TPA: hypothetical protein VHW66_18140 [Stellaceae bacterium]|nr:hypothetical protein [Stellaceae bacterium]